MGKIVSFKKVAGQDRIKQTLAAAIAGNTLGHAYLFAGEPGVGTFALALELALGILCDSDDSPCYSCVSCKAVLGRTHPDFHMVLPFALEKEDHSGSDLTAIGWERLGEECLSTLAEPYRIKKHDGVAQIPVEWIREVNHAILRGRIQDKLTIAIICGVDIMRAEAANALLKTLEEPPPNTLIILTTDRLQAVLPTIVSRCQIARLGWVPDDEARMFVAQMRNVAVDDPAVIAAVHAGSGSIGKALEFFDEPDVSAELGKRVLTLLGDGDWATAAKGMETLLVEAGDNEGVCERMIAGAANVLRDEVVGKASHDSKYISTDSEFRLVTASADPLVCGNLLEAFQKAINAVRARGNPLLVLTALAIDCMEIIDEQKQ
jgi:DNA polymerase III gamma/tau subunit